MAKKIRDLAVKVGSYEKDGQTKGRWQNVGALMKGDDGGEFIMLSRAFNPAGVPGTDERESILVSCFPLKDQQQSQPAPAPSDDYDDGGIPF